MLRFGFGGVRGATLAGVFDGHGVHGRAAAAAAAAAFASALESDADRALARERAPRVAAFEAAAAAAHEAVVAAVPDASLSGTTACVVLATPDGGLAIANVGDSRAVLGRVGEEGHPEAVRLTRDHTLDDEAERQRIMRAGGSVRQPRNARGAPDGPYRVFGRSPTDVAAGLPGLAMSRSLGDTSSHALGVTHAPSVRLHAPGDGDLCVIVASNGVWNVMTPSDAVALVAGVRLAPFSGLTPADAVTLEAHERCKAALGRGGRGSVDDVACVVLHLCEPPLAARAPRPPPDAARVTPGWPSCDAANSEAAVAVRDVRALSPPAAWFESALAAGARDAGGCASSAAGSDVSSVAMSGVQLARQPSIDAARRSDDDEAVPPRAPGERGGETLRAGRARRPAAGRYDRAESPEAADVAFRGEDTVAPLPTPTLASLVAPPSPAARAAARISRPTPIPEDAPAAPTRSTTAPRPVVRLPRVVKAYPGGSADAAAASAPGGLSLLTGRARSRSLSGSWLAFGSAGSLGASMGVAGSAGSLAALSASSDDGSLTAAAAADRATAGAPRWTAAAAAAGRTEGAPSSGDSERRVHGSGWAQRASSSSSLGAMWDGPASAPVGWSLASPRSAGGGALTAAARADDEAAAMTPDRAGRPPLPRHPSAGWEEGGTPR